MITEDEFERANILKDKIDFISNFISGQKNEYVRSTFGLMNRCDISKNNKWDEFLLDGNESDYFKFMRRHMDFVEDLNKAGFGLLEAILDQYKKEYREIIGERK